MSRVNAVRAEQILPKRIVVLVADLSTVAAHLTATQGDLVLPMGALNELATIANEAARVAVENAVSKAHRYFEVQALRASGAIEIGGPNVA